MHYSRTILFLMLAIVLQACAPMPKNDWTKPDNTATRIVTRNDEFTKATSYTGPNCAPSSSPDTLFLRAWRSREGSITYQIYVANYYRGDWRFYDSAWDSNGTQLSVTQIARKVGACSSYGCTLEEHLGINVTREYLVRASTTAEGVAFKLIGKAGEMIFSVPPAYVSGFLDVVK